MTGRGVSGRGWAYVGSVLGAAVSGHGCAPWTPPAGWAPPTGSVAGGALWPVMVVVAVEILTRVDWPPSGRWLADLNAAKAQADETGEGRT